MSIQKIVFEVEVDFPYTLLDSDVKRALDELYDPMGIKRMSDKNYKPVRISVKEISRTEVR